MTYLRRKNTKNKLYFCRFATIISICSGMNRYYRFVVVILLLRLTCELMSQSLTNNISVSSDRKITLKTFIQIIENHTGLNFIYSDDLIKDKFVSPFKFDSTIENVLNNILFRQAINYVEYNGKIILREFSADSGYIPMLKLDKARNIISDKVITAFEGRVYSVDSGDALSNANIYVSGKNVGTHTDSEGHFIIEAEPGDTLLISLLGYNDVKLIAGVDDSKSIPMTHNSVFMDEICVVGYGVQPKKLSTGAITTYRPSKVSSIGVTLDDELSSRIAGLNITATSGLPESASTILLRGVSTLNNNGNFPLVVVDNIPVYGNERNFNVDNIQYASVFGKKFTDVNVVDDVNYLWDFERNPLYFLNTNDIESVDILKDAYATAIYGSRGASGVMIVTTKNGNHNSDRYSVSYQASVSKLMNTPSLLGAAEYSGFYTNYYNKNYPVQAYTDWVKEVTRIAFGQDMNVSYRGGRNKTKYYLSTTYSDRQTNIINNDYYLFNTRFNYINSIRKDIKFGFNSNLTVTNNSSLNAQDIYRSAILKSPNLPVYDGDGQYFYGKGENPRGEAIINPVAMANRDKGYMKSTRFIGKIWSEVKLPYNIKYKFEYGADHIVSNSFIKKHTNYDPAKTQATEINRRSTKRVIHNILSTQRDVNNHKFDIMAGHSLENSNEKFETLYGHSFTSQSITDISMAEYNTIVNDNNNEWALFSLFSRLNYSYSEKYLVGISYRVDGSSRFPANNRYVLFPAYSLGWNISEEEFMKPLYFLNLLKLRISYGESGMDGSFGYYGFKGYYGQEEVVNYSGLKRLYIVRPDNPNLEWEVTKSVNLGLDVNMFDSKLILSLDLYNKVIENMLYVSDIPYFFGYSSSLQNIGDMQNRGVEVLLTFNRLQFGDLYFSMSANISHNKNIIKKLNFEGEYKGAEADAYKYFKEGEEAGQFNLYDWVRVSSETGNPLWRLKDGTLSEIHPAKLGDNIDHKKISGSNLPKFFGGLSPSFEYKGFEISSSFSFSYGNKMINGAKAILMDYSNSNAINLSSDMLNYWKAPGDNTEIAKLKNNSIVYTSNFISSRTSDQFLEDASYLRLKSLILKYSFSDKYLKKVFKIESINLYAGAYNLFTFTNYSGSDVEVSAFGSSVLTGGYDELTIPNSRTFLMGVKVNF